MLQSSVYRHQGLANICISNGGQLLKSCWLTKVCVISRAAWGAECVVQHGHSLFLAALPCVLASVQFFLSETSDQLWGVEPHRTNDIQPLDGVAGLLSSPVMLPNSRSRATSGSSESPSLQRGRGRHFLPSESCVHRDPLSQLGSSPLRSTLPTPTMLPNPDLLWWGRQWLAGRPYHPISFS